MRWYWIDRFLEFESGRYAKAVKNVSLAEEYLHEHFPGCPILPSTLVVEGLAQTGGLLVSEYNQFTEKVVLAKLSHAKFFGPAVPGDSLIYHANLLFVNEGGAVVHATSHKKGELHAEMEIVFAHLDDAHGRLFDPENFLRMMRLLGAYEVGHAPDGGPLMPPQRLLEAASVIDASGAVTRTKT